MQMRYRRPLYEEYGSELSPDEDYDDDYDEEYMDPVIGVIKKKQIAGQT
jgi:hypothetical protein